MSLDAVRAALRDDASAEAAAILAAAERDAQEVLQRARAEADDVLGRARAEGEAETARRAARERARARREARSRVLRARAEARSRLAAALAAAARDLAHDPGYPTLLDRLEDSARAQLGSRATVTREPGGEPGLVAQAPGRRVDYRLDRVARRVLEEAGPEVEALWS